MITIKSSGFSPSELQTLMAGVDLANRVLLSPEFKQAILGHLTAEGTPGFDNTTDNVATVFQKVAFGDSSLDVSIVSYSLFNVGKRHEVAHENPDGGIVLNRKFFAVEDQPSLVNTLIHEYTHMKGYSHDYQPTGRRPFSVPYGVGEIAQKVAGHILGLSE